MSRIVSALVLCLAARAAFALEVAGVSPEAIKGAPQGDFSFGAVSLKSVAWTDGAVVLPQTEVKGRKYSDVKLLSKSAYLKFEACFKDGFRKPAKAPARPVFRIDGLRPLKSPVRVGNAEVSLDGELLVVAGVMASKKEEGSFWVAFPPELVFNDPAFKAAVESAVISAWTKKNK